MTYTDLINYVLRRLREDEVSSPTASSYSKLIGDLVNEAKREVEDAWDWNVLRTTIQVATVTDTSRYELTGSGDRFRTLNVMNQTDQFEVIRKNHKYMTHMLLNSGSKGSPLYYDYNDKSTNGNTYVDLYPIPNQEYLVNFNLVIPQDDFTLGTEELEVPSWPVQLLAYAKALAERGEDQGNTHGEAFNNASIALGDAIAIDISNTTGEDEWYYA